MGRRARGTGNIRAIGTGKNRRYQARRPQVLGGECKTFDLKADADAWLDSKAITRAGMTFRGWAAHWLRGGRRDEVEAGTLSVETYKSYENALRNINNVIGDMDLASITNKDIDKVLAASTNQKLRSWARRKMRTVLSQVFKRAQANGLISNDPTRLAKPIKKNVSDETIARRALTLGEQKRLREAAVGTNVEGYVSLALATGARPGELFALRYADLDFVKNTVSITASFGKVALGGPRVRKSTKTDKSARTNKVQSEDLAIFRTYDGSRDAFLFASASGQPKGQRNFTRRDLAPVLKSAKVEGVTLYTFRHTVATNFARAAVNIIVAAKFLGTSPRMLEQVYVHANDDLISDAADKLAALKKAS